MKLPLTAALKHNYCIRVRNEGIRCTFFLPDWFVCFKHCFSCKQIYVMKAKRKVS